MRLTRTKSFDKEFRRFPEKLKAKINKRIVLFANDPRHRSLRNHILHGEYEGMRSISMTGDIRIIYAVVDEDTVLFLHIGTHHELYGS